MVELRASEKRYYKRLDLNGKAAIQVKRSRIRLPKVYMDDLSVGGFHINTPQRLEIGDDIEFALRTKFLERPLSGIAKIRHVNRIKNSLLPRYSTGVEFIDTDRNTLKNAIKSNLKVRHRIDKRKRRFIQHVSLNLKLAPFIIIFTSLVIIGLNAFVHSSQEESRYNKQYQAALIHYLDQAH